MTHNRTIQSAAVLCMIASLIGAALVSPQIDARRTEPRKVLGDQVAQTLPPHMAVMTVMLSVFRGIAVDILWYRAQSLQDEGKFYEINQICQLITSLQPYFEEVWVFQAWNMAFNVSVLTKTPDERWDWINKGIVLLRDQGIPLNPKSYTLYKELDWFFYFKIGQYSDDYHWYYKAKLALEWQQLLGYQPEGLTTAQAIDQFASIANAPDTLDQVKAQHPHVQALLEKLAGIGYAPDERLVQEVGRINIVVLSPTASFYGVSLQHPPARGVDASLCNVMADPAVAADFDPLLRHLRKRALIDHYRMDPAFMLELMNTYGPLDWRHYDAHSLYWSSQGTRVSEAGEKRTGEQREKDIQLLNTYRGSIHSIQDLMYRGHMTFDPLLDPPRQDFLPDPRFIPAYDHALDLVQEYMKEFDVEKVFGGTAESFQQGHSNFLAQAVQQCYLYGDLADAEKYYEKLRRLYGGNHFPGPGPRYEKTIEDFVLNHLVYNLDTMYSTQQFIQAMVLNAFEQGLVQGRPQSYDHFINLARAAHEKWNKGRETLANREGVPRDRMKLLPFDQMVGEILVDYLNKPNVPSVTRAQVWQVTSDELRRRIFDRVVTVARNVAVKEGLDPVRAFPEPPGMALYRRLHPMQAPTMEAAPPDLSKSLIHTERK